MGNKLAPVDRRVCTACGREGCHLLYRPVSEPGADAIVHSGERLCQRCFDARSAAAVRGSRGGLFVRCGSEAEVPAPAVKRDCCGGCRAQGSSQR